jgi:hypothetical protein
VAAAGGLTAAARGSVEAGLAAAGCSVGGWRNAGHPHVDPSTTAVTFPPVRSLLAGPFAAPAACSRFLGS